MFSIDFGGKNEWASKYRIESVNGVHEYKYNISEFVVFHF